MSHYGNINSWVDTIICVFASALSSISASVSFKTWKVVKIYTAGFLLMWWLCGVLYLAESAVI